MQEARNANATMAKTEIHCSDRILTDRVSLKCGSVVGQTISGLVPVKLGPKRQSKIPLAGVSVEWLCR